jgi:tetratricopeptide (TPR) repeat protein
LADARFELGSLELAEGHLDAAEAQLHTVLDKAPAHAAANVAYGDLLLRKGDLEGARRHYEAAIYADPKLGPAHYKLSTALMRLGDTERAAKEREAGAALNAEALKAAKTVLVLAEPDGTLLTGDPRKKAAP